MADTCLCLVTLPATKAWKPAQPCSRSTLGPDRLLTAFQAEGNQRLLGKWRIPGLRQKMHRTKLEHLVTSESTEMTSLQASRQKDSGPTESCHVPPGAGGAPCTSVRGQLRGTETSKPAM